LNDPQKQAVAERRFRPEFRVAFDAWMATDPFHNPRAAPGPTYVPQYKLADQARADALDREAEAAAAAGDHSAVVGDEYVRITVFLAAVLFLWASAAPSGCPPSAMCSSSSARCCSSWRPR
jgi:hypothetical protein